MVKTRHNADRRYKHLRGSDNKRLSAFLFQKLLGRRQTLLRDFQIIVAVTKLNQQFGQRNQVFHLEAQRASAAAAHFFQFCPLFFGHPNVVLERFFGHARSLPDRIFELMRNYDLQWDATLQ
jgi:hypothetical protein